MADLYAVALARADVGPSSTFASLGGDSLSYVEVSIRLEELLGTLPPSWHVRPVGELEELAPSREERSVSAPSRRTPGGVLGRLWSERRTLETNVWLRALAIVLIVGTHADVFVLQGTAHALLVLVGYNVVRFALASDRRRDRLRSLGRGATRVVLPTLAVIVPAHLVWGHYQPRNLVLANWLLGEERLGPPWRFWFIEALVVALVVAMVLVALPAFARAERRWRFGLPVALTTVAFTARLELYPLPGPRMQGSALVVLFLFFLGWAIARATTRRQLWVVTVLTVAMAGTFSGNPARDLLTVGFVLLLIWKPVSRVPRAVVPTVQVLAASSLFVYVIHWQVLELLWGSPILAFLGSLAVGIGYWWLWARVMPAAWRAARNTILRIVTDGHAPNSPNRPASQYLRSKLLQGQTSRKERRRCIAPFPIALPSWGRRPRSRSWPGARPLQ